MIIVINLYSGKMFNIRLKRQIWCLHRPLKRNFSHVLESIDKEFQ